MTVATRPRLAAPAGVCDTHLHFYGPKEQYPPAPTSALPVQEYATVDAYRAVMERLGIERAIIVQPSAYGTDNRCTLDGIKALGERARGVVVVDNSVGDDELERMTAAGVRGIRFHMLRGGVLGWEILEEMARRVHAFGWHVQLQMDGRELAEKEPVLRRLPGTLVIDHVGKFLEPVDVDHPGFQTLLRLVEGGRCWVKLSAPYETSKLGPPYYDDVGALAKALVKAAPERMVWASNWPHPSVQGREPQPDDAELMDVLLDWAEDESTRHRILVDNPAVLYGFTPG